MVKLYHNIIKVIVIFMFQKLITHDSYDHITRRYEFIRVVGKGMYYHFNFLTVR